MKKNDVESILKRANHSLSYSPMVIEVRNKKYIFNYPVRSLFKIEDDVIIIKNELLDIIGTGDTQEEAEQSFNEELVFYTPGLNN